jgi:hypothetical protein
VRAARVAAMVWLVVAATAYADDIDEPRVLRAIEDDLQGVLDRLEEERRKPRPEQEADKVAAQMRQLDALRQRLARFQPVAPVLQTSKRQVENDLERITYLANDMWTALQAPELVAARRAKEARQKRQEDHAAIEKISAKLLQLEKERALEASRPLREQRRAVYERLRDEGAAALGEVDRRLASDDPDAQALRGPFAKYVVQVIEDLNRIEDHERALQRQREASTRQREANAREHARRTAIQAKGWSASVTEAVIQRQVALGMTPEQVREAWGPPQRINRTLTRAGEHQQWVYGSGQYLYFEDGRLSSIQTSETPRP